MMTIFAGGQPFSMIVLPSSSASVSAASTAKEGAAGVASGSATAAPLPARCATRRSDSGSDSNAPTAALPAVLWRLNTHCWGELTCGSTRWGTGEPGFS